MKNLYKETFSQVRSSYELDLRDFERVDEQGVSGSEKTGKTWPIRKTLLIAAAVAVLAALGITASATGFFGMSDMVIPQKDGGIVSPLGLKDTPEAQALGEYLAGELTLEEAAEKHGLTIPERCEVFQYDELEKLQGGELFDGRHSRNAAYIYENGTFGMDGSFTASDGTKAAYQLFRSVKGSLVDISFSESALGEDYENWNIDVGGVDVCLVLGDTRSLIAADMDGCFVITVVLTGTRGDDPFGGPITRDHLEELAGSFNWDALGRVVEPDLPPELPEVLYGAGVELRPEYIDESQSFDVNLAGWGSIRFITYLPTPEFGDARFFLSRDGEVSDYEFHPFCGDALLDKVAAVSFEDLTGDGYADVLVIIDYKNAGAGLGQDYRDVRVYTASGDGDFAPAWELMEELKGSLDTIDVSSVRKYCGEKLGRYELKNGDTVLKTIQFAVPGLGDQKDIPMELDVIGKAGGDGRYGVRELRVYDMTALGRTEPAQMIELADIGEDFVSGALGDGYTECWSLEETVSMVDMNFDGAPDIEVFGWVPNNTIPHYYFLWRADAGRFEYALTLQGATVDETNRRVVAEYKSGPAGSEYTRDFYEPNESGDLVPAGSETVDYGQEPDDSGKPNDYAGVLAALDKELPRDASYRDYAMFDLTGDHYPELIVVTGMNEAEAKARVYTMDRGDLMTLGEFGMSHSILYDKDGQLIKLEGHMGYETISEIGFNGSTVTEKAISHRLLGEDDEYAVPGTSVKTAAIGDSWLLDGVDQYAGYDAVLDMAPEGARWAAFDMDFDGVRELIVSDGSKWTFYTAKNGGAEEIGTLDSANSSLHIYGDGHTLGLLYSVPSGGEISQVYNDGGRLSVSRVTGWDSGSPAEDPGPELTFKNKDDRSF